MLSICFKKHFIDFFNNLVSTLHFLINIFIVFVIILSLEMIIRFLNIVGLQGYEKKAFYFENGIILSKPNNTFKVFGKKSKTDKTMIKY